MRTILSIPACWVVYSIIYAFLPVCSVPIIVKLICIQSLVLISLRHILPEYLCLIIAKVVLQGKLHVGGAPMRSSDVVISVAWHRPPCLQANIKTLEVNFNKTFHKEKNKFLREHTNQVRSSLSLF